MTAPTIAREIKQAFGFLEATYGFQVNEESLPPGMVCVHYHGTDLDVEVGWYKGEIEVTLVVTRTDDTFRPYRSRRFSLAEVVRAMACPLPHHPPLPPTVTNAETARPVLAFYAELVEISCPNLFRGDLSTLAEISRRRPIPR